MKEGMKKKKLNAFIAGCSPAVLDGVQGVFDFFVGHISSGQTQNLLAWFAVDNGEEVLSGQVRGLVIPGG